MARPPREKPVGKFIISTVTRALRVPDLVSLSLSKGPEHLTPNWSLRFKPTVAEAASKIVPSAKSKLSAKAGQGKPEDPPHDAVCAPASGSGRSHMPDLSS